MFELNDIMVLNAVILATAVIAGGVMLMPRLALSVNWQAMITPLASIIGSGFLVLGPILGVSFGQYAPLAMAILCIGSFFIGSAIRYNIAVIDRDDGQRTGFESHMEMVASWALAFAYVISVAYYLNLFGAFGVSLTLVNDSFHAKMATSAIFLVILVVGWLYGFKALERMEQITVSIKLAIIAALLVGLAWYFSGKVSSDGLVFNPPTVSGWAAVTLMFGLIITVQGFETSRYLGDDYNAQTRIRTMRYAQIFSTIIYLVYISLLTYSFQPQEVSISETAIIDMMGIVAPILPILLVAAALSAQFSAAVADTGGSGGLVQELTGGRLKTRNAYAILVASGLVVTWSFNVFEIISYASRAFAFYYALQCAIATIAARRRGEHLARVSFYLGLVILCGLIVVFGVPVE